MMGLTYSISALSYLTFGNSTFSEFAEIFVSLQGVWVFALFILKQRVVVLIKKNAKCFVN